MPPPLQGPRLVPTQLSELTSIGRYLADSPQPLPPYCSPELMAAFRRDTRVEKLAARSEEFRVASTTFLTDVAGWGCRNPANPSFDALAAGLATTTTRYDTAKGPVINVMQHPALRDAYIAQYARGLFYLLGLTHLSSLTARHNMLHEANVPENVPRRDALLETSIDRREALTWDDYRWTPTERLGDPATEEDARTTEVRAQGLWSRMATYKGRPIINGPIVGNSDPHYTCALGADLAFLAPFYIPADGLHADKELGLKAQIAFLEYSMRVLANHPILWLHPHGHEEFCNTGMTVRQHLLTEANKRVGVTLKVDDLKDVERRVKVMVHEYGRRSFRLFDPRSTYNLPRATEIVAKELEKAGFSDCMIASSLVIGEGMAIACYRAGANVVVLNTTDGDRCSTASGTDMIANNPANAFKIQANPILAPVGKLLDGGVQQGWVPLTALGFHGALKHGSLVGGTIHQTPGLHAIWDTATKSPCKPDPGEAARSSKEKARNLDPTGLPEMVEGIDRHRTVFGNEAGTTWPEVMWSSFYRAGAKICCFLGVKNLEALRRWHTPVFLKPTEAAKKKAAPTPTGH